MLFYAKIEDDPDTSGSNMGGKKRSSANLPATTAMRKQTSVASNTDTFLDPNHTHFILVDDGSENQFGKEIEFRASLENELRKGHSLKYYQMRRAR